jgi:Domain of unknown function (DUF4282)/Protein of unknown function (DUF2510)
VSEPAEITAGGFFRSLYDFKFRSLVAARWLRFLYKWGVILSTIGTILALITLVAAMSKSPLGGLLGIVFVLIYYVIWLVSLRIVVEFLIVFFGMGDNVHAIRLATSPSTNGSTATSPVPTSGGAPVAVAELSVEPERMEQVVQTAPAGWYEAPSDPSKIRYWTGSAWTEHYRPR